MMGKLNEMQQRMEETKKKLDVMIVEAEAGSGAVKVKINGNRQVKSITISEELHRSDKEELEELLTVALNRGLAEAEKLHESEMKNSASGMLPGLDGLF